LPVKKRIEYDYSKYLGPEAKKKENMTYDGAGIFIQNH